LNAGTHGNPNLRSSSDQVLNLAAKYQVGFIGPRPLGNLERGSWGVSFGGCRIEQVVEVVASTRGPEKDYSPGFSRDARVLVLAGDILGFVHLYSNPRKLIALILPAAVHHTWEHSPSIKLLFLSLVNCLERFAANVETYMR
jgi:hypothetical protein